jgi:hypothetical protein
MLGKGQERITLLQITTLYQGLPISSVKGEIANIFGLEDHTISCHKHPSLLHESSHDTTQTNCDGRVSIKFYLHR